VASLSPTQIEKQRGLQALRLLVRQAELESEKIIERRPTSLRLKPMKSQWGSCNSKGVIAINTKLMYLSERLVRYVVHHEVVHLKVRAHDRTFRHWVEKLFPDRLILDRQLRHAAPILRQKA
jgi:predicted metal-dependent hydrolase